jgi:hypothetical protein
LNDSFNASCFNNKKSFHYCDFGKWEAKSHKQKALSTVNKRQKKQTNDSKKNTKNNKTHLRNLPEMDKGQRSIKIVKRSLSFLITIFNRSDERKSSKTNPSLKKKG